MSFSRTLFTVLMISLATTLGCEKKAETPAPSSTEAPAETKSAAVTGEATLVSLKVPTMDCPFACWPKVEKTLEAMACVSDVTLAPQKEEGVIDNPQVEIKCEGEFNAAEAIEALKAAGFEGAEVVASN